MKLLEVMMMIMIALDIKVIQIGNQQGFEYIDEEEQKLIDDYVSSCKRKDDKVDYSSRRKLKKKNILFYLVKP